MTDQIREVVPCAFCKCGLIIQKDRCPDWVDVRAYGSANSEAKKVVKLCKRWMEDHLHDIHGALYDFTEERVYFFPIHAVMRYDPDLEESLCDLHFEVVGDDSIDIKFSAMTALPGDMEETRRYADFILEADLTND